jgi:type IV secretory pathway protease TraF
LHLGPGAVKSASDRSNLPNGHAVMTAGVAALGPEAVARIVKTIAVYGEVVQFSKRVRIYSAAGRRKDRVCLYLDLGCRDSPA